ncbi:hypothetical protein AQS8620_01704 [Aquimixticola soesokkakensis]|uniref:Hedgehog/Intein (Hint) domain-containing protein n=1 Tax=Aquimixticola soesokkakensis TaxID=1519096 RepID=A0A1Y5SJY6_9RHOB|nr:Hint domain-containing protein [Aquimixticola soesokkakensis]SLN42583.1 hypothetical protein AQS8620_01704 [Aquimixticola soesokkakensis]
MAYSIATYDIADVVVISGADPFASDTSGNGAAVGSTFTLASDAKTTRVDIIDNDGFFNDGDGSQDLAAPLEGEGQTANAGDRITPEYSYRIRPNGGALDGSDDITIYVYELGLDNDADGFAASSRLEPGQTYTIMQHVSDDPSVAANTLAVCFCVGTLIATPSGWVAIETLSVGDLVETRDHGAQPLRWLEHRHIPRALLAQAPMLRPVVFSPGSLGRGVPSAPLWLSAQHRILVSAPAVGRMSAGTEALVAAHRFVARRDGQAGWSGPELAAGAAVSGYSSGSVMRRVLPPAGVSYIHLAFERHELICANGAWVESLFDGPMTRRAVSGAGGGSGAGYEAAIGAKAHTPARPFLEGRRAARLLWRLARNRQPVQPPEAMPDCGTDDCVTDRLPDVFRAGARQPVS